VRTPDREEVVERHPRPLAELAGAERRFTPQSLLRRQDDEPVFVDRLSQILQFEPSIEEPVEQTQASVGLLTAEAGQQALGFEVRWLS